MIKVPVTFLNNTVIDVALFAERLRKRRDPVSAWLWTQLDGVTQDLIQDFQSAWSDPEPLQKALRVNLNRLINGGVIYKEEIFKDVVCRAGTKALLAGDPVGEAAVRLNRQLLEDSYPGELSRDYEFDFLKGEFDRLALEWSQSAFRREVATSFQLARTFDSPRSTRSIATLCDCSKEDLQILADVLPLGVLFDNPIDQARRDSLLPEQKAVVDRLRAAIKDYGSEKGDGEISKMYNKEIKREFNSAVKLGNRMMNEYGERHKGELNTGARGEWGLRFLDDGFMYTVSFKLARYMLLDYKIGLSSRSISRCIRFLDNYLGMLGFGKGEWVVETASKFESKLMKAMEFALWHKQEYQEILKILVRGA